MSIQNDIDLALSKKGSEMRTITVIGKQGTVHLPEKCYLHLRKCRISKMLIEPNCIVVIEESEILDLPDEKGELPDEVRIKEFCTVTMDRVAIRKNTFIDQSKGTFKHVTILKPVEFTASMFEGYILETQGEGTFTLKDASKLTLRDCTLRGRVGATIQEDSKAVFRNVNIETDQFCLDVETGVVEYAGGSISSGTTCIQAKEKSRLSMSGISSFFGERGVIDVSSETEMKVNNSGTLECAQGTTIVVKDRAKLELYRTNAITCINTVIRVDSFGELTLSKIPLIKSTRSEAIFVDEGTIFAREIGTVQGKLNALVTQNRSLIRFLIFNDIRSELEVCIQSGESDDYELIGGNLIQSEKKDTITGTNGKLVIRTVKEIISPLMGAIQFTGSGKIELYNTTEVRAKDGNAISVGDSAQIILAFAKLQKTDNGNAIKMGKDGLFRATDSGDFLSAKKDAIVTGVNCDLELATFENIISEKMVGLKTETSRLTLRDGELISGKLGGIEMNGSSSFATIERLKLLDGGDGKALYLKNCTFQIRDCEAVQSKGIGYHFDSASNGTVLKVDTITTTQDTSIKVTKGCTVDINSIDTVTCVSGEAINISESEFTSIGILAVKGSGPTSLKIEEGSKVTIRGTIFDWDVNSEDSEFTLLSSTVKKKFIIDKNTLITDRLIVEDDATITDGVNRIQYTSFKKKLTFTQATILGTRFDCEDKVIFTNSAGEFISCNASAWNGTQSALLFIGCGGVVSKSSGTVVDINKGSHFDVKSALILLQGSVSMGV